jgi:hypothetical protein
MAWLRHWRWRRSTTRATADFRVVPTCPFVRKWLGLHPELLALVDPPYVKSLERRPRV